MFLISSIEPDRTAPMSNNSTESSSPFQKAWELSRNGSHREAIQLIESTPDLRPLDRVQAALAHFHYMLGDYISAEGYAQQCLSMNRRNKTALTILGEIRCKSQRYHDATDYFKEAYQYYPKDLYVAVRLGQMLLDQSRTQEAIAVFEKAREFNPQHAELLDDLYYCYQITGNQQAADLLKRSINHLPFNNQDNELINKLRSLEPEIAVRQIEIILRLPSATHKTPLHALMAGSLIKLGRFNEAIPHLEQVILERPRSESTKIRLANCYTRCGRAKDALELLHSLKIPGIDLRVIQAKVEALAAAGNGQHAMDIAFRFLAQYPDDKRLRKIVNLLRKKGMTPSPGLLEENPDTSP